MTAHAHDKPICLIAHAASSLDRRGFTVAEVEATIRGSLWMPARNHRLQATRDFAFDDEWNGKRFATKRVRPVLVEEADEIVVVTVDTYFV